MVETPNSVCMSKFGKQKTKDCIVDHGYSLKWKCQVEIDGKPRDIKMKYCKDDISKYGLGSYIVGTENKISTHTSTCKTEIQKKHPDVENCGHTLKSIVSVGG